MERINRILQHETYRICCESIAQCEKDRIFCHHDMSHFLDVARLAMIINLQEEMGVTQEKIYAAAVLHDIGRHLQYLEGTPHEQASAEIAPGILKDCGFDDGEVREITEAIRQHRNGQIRDDKTLSGLIYRGDKMSRSCFACPVENICDWKQERKNMRLIL